ncbi:MAG: phosphate ABC transporter substrate-binding protein PstS [Nitrospirae bacterium]|nr:phosphate ABC transporter substrate-binding protein PstS [Nitrospirota bacterium]MBI3351348.1 phosphate ABC transporter substrate-binding protein PstS [Nitrospirota bacterium]
MNFKLTLTSLLIGLGLVIGGVTSSHAADALLINGAGATFPYPIYSKWFDEFGKKHPELHFNYQSVGSGAGIRQVGEMTVDFGATDGPMTDDQLKASKQKLLHFPTVLGADVPTYNIPEVSAELNFTGEVLANIFLGKVTKWNDSAIAGANPGVNLPDKEIMVIHRSDGSGTTYIWTDFLSKVSPEWDQKVGKGTSVNWPVGLGGKGNEGVSGLIKQTPYSIGYVELIYAVQNHLSYGKIQNKEGHFIKATLETVSEAAAGALKTMPEDFRVSITNPPGKGVYPASSFTWLLIPEEIKDLKKRKAIVEFLKWMIHDGQAYTKDLAYAPLPKEVVQKEERAISKIK